MPVIRRAAAASGLCADIRAISRSPSATVPVYHAVIVSSGCARPPTAPRSPGSAASRAVSADRSRAKTGPSAAASNRARACRSAAIARSVAWRWAASRGTKTPPRAPISPADIPRSRCSSCTVTDSTGARRSSAARWRVRATIRHCCASCRPEKPISPSTGSSSATRSRVRTGALPRNFMRTSFQAARAASPGNHRQGTPTGHRYGDGSEPRFAAIACRAAPAARGFQPGESGAHSDA